MKLSVKGLALTAGLFWGLAVLLVGLANLCWSPFGAVFLDMVGSVYPGYSPGTGAASVAIGTLYAVLDGTIAGAIFAWLYNRLE